MWISTIIPVDELLFVCYVEAFHYLIQLEGHFAVLIQFVLLVMLLANDV